MRRVSRLAVPAVATAVLVASPRRCTGVEIGPGEEKVFRTFNDAPDQIYPPVWAVMQSGSLAGAYLVAGDLLRRGRHRRSAAVAVGGTAVWGGVKLVKPLIGRGRPKHHLDSVNVRGQPQTGLGFPSGHAAVALAVGLIATHGSSRAVRTAALLSAGVTGAARMYVGAHLPHDVAGGFAIGALSGWLVGAFLED